jgi:hypothetical protein
MNEFLTISISETGRSQYKVVTVCKQDSRFYALNITEDQFVNNNGSIAWDLFGWTKANLNYVGRSLYRPVGTTPIVVNYMSKEEMIGFFEKIKVKLKTFLDVECHLEYGVIKVDEVLDIQPPYTSDNMTKQRVRIVSEKYPSYPLLNKDYKWLNYWENVREEQMQEKIEHWHSILNHEDSSVYAVLYRHQFRTSFQKWICGFHCI